MAYLRRVPRSPYWIACFRMPNGRYVNRSTKARERKVALRLADSWEEASRRRLTEAQARRVITDIYQQINGTPLVTPSFSNYLTQWLSRKRCELRPISYRHYESVINNFKAALADRTEEPLHHIAPNDVAKWRDQVADRTTATNANNKLKIVRTFFQSAWRDGVITDNPAAKIQILRTKGSNRKPFTLDNVRAILEVANGEWRGMVLMGLYTGQRLKDIATLTWTQIDLRTGVLTITTSKTGRHQIIPLAQPILNYLADLPGTDDPTAPLFPDAHGIVARRQLTTGLSNQFYDILAKANLVVPRPRQHRALTGVGRAGKRSLGQLSFHCLRHTATSMLKMSGVPEAIVRDIIGHESALVSRMYTHVDEDLKRQAVGRLPDVTEAKAAAQ